MSRLKKLERGDDKTLLDAKTANEIVDAANKLLNVRVVVGGAGGSKLDVSGTQAVLTISASDIKALLGSAAGIDIVVSPTAPVIAKAGTLWLQSF